MSNPIKEEGNDRPVYVPEFASGKILDELEELDSMEDFDDYIRVEPSGSLDADADLDLDIKGVIKNISNNILSSESDFKNIPKRTDESDAQSYEVSSMSIDILDRSIPANISIPINKSNNSQKKKKKKTINKKNKKNPSIGNSRHPIDMDLYTTSKGPWNYRTQLLLQNIGEKSGVYQVLHTRDQHHYEDINRIFNYVEGVLAAIIGGLSGAEFITALIQSGSSSDAIIIAIIVLTGVQIFFMILYGIFRAFKEYGDYPERIKDHRDTASSYLSINLEIKKELAKDLESRDSSN